MSNTDHGAENDDPYLRQSLEIPRREDPACGGRCGGSPGGGKPLPNTRPAHGELFLVDPVTEYETYKRLGVEIVPSKSNELGQQAMQLDMFKK